MGSIPSHITGRPVGWSWHAATLENWHRVWVAVPEAHCLVCQPPGETTPVPTEAARRRFVRAHRHKAVR